jgi:hypothetical protein
MFSEDTMTLVTGVHGRKKQQDMYDSICIGYFLYNKV